MVGPFDAGAIFGKAASRQVIAADGIHYFDRHPAVALNLHEKLIVRIDGENPREAGRGSSWRQGKQIVIQRHAHIPGAFKDESVAVVIDGDGRDEHPIRNSHRQSDGQWVIGRHDALESSRRKVGVNQHVRPFFRQAGTVFSDVMSYSLLAFQKPDRVGFAQVGSEPEFDASGETVDFVPVGIEPASVKVDTVNGILAIFSVRIRNKEGSQISKELGSLSKSNWVLHFIADLFIAVRHVTRGSFESSLSRRASGDKNYRRSLLRPFLGRKGLACQQHLPGALFLS